MFGMGFMEIFLILLVAIIALGPEKLPGAIVDTVKFFKKIKNEISDAKSTLDKELDLSEMRKDADKLKESISNLQSMANVDLDELTKEKPLPTPPEPKTIDTPTTAIASSKKETISMSEGNKA